MKGAIVTACRADCPDACSLIAKKSGVSGGWLIKGNPEHPVTRGFTCNKVSYFLKRHQSASRITNPLIKHKGKWVPISREEAIELCAEKIQGLRDSPERILHLQGHGIRGVFVDSVRYFFASLGTATTVGSLCDDAGIEASRLDFGVLDHNDISDLENANIIVNWGRDVKRGSIHLAVILKNLREKGGQIITISPGGCDLDGLCDEHVLIKPGTDRFLAAAILKELISNDSAVYNRTIECSNGQEFLKVIKKHSTEDLLRSCEVKSEDFQKLLKAYSGKHRVSTIIAWGIQRYTHGGETVRWINALAYLSGHFGNKGEGVYYNVLSRRHFRYDGIISPEDSCSPRRLLLLPQIGRELINANPPIEFMWINGTNIVNQAPASRRIAEALRKVIFVVVVDAFMTDTAMNADLFLPSTLMWEEEDIVGSAMHNFVNYCAPFLTPPEGALSDRGWIEQVARKLAPPVVMPSRSRCFETAMSSPAFAHTSFVRRISLAASVLNSPKLHSFSDPPGRSRWSFGCMDFGRFASCAKIKGWKTGMVGVSAGKNEGNRPVCKGRHFASICGSLSERRLDEQRWRCKPNHRGCCNRYRKYGSILRTEG